MFLFFVLEFGKKNLEFIFYWVLKLRKLKLRLLYKRNFLVIGILESLVGYFFLGLVGRGRVEFRGEVGRKKEVVCMFFL